MNQKVFILFALIMTIDGILFFSPNISLAAEGDIWIIPFSQSQAENQNFDVKVYVDTGTKHLNGFNMYLDFDPTYIAIDTSQGEDPNADDGKGFHKGDDSQDYIMGSNINDITAGHFRFAGNKAENGTIGSGQNIITIHLKTTGAFTSGSTQLNIRADEMSESGERDINVGTITGATIINSATASIFRADVDNNSQINTTDAMLTLRNSLGLDMSGTNWQSSSTTGDVNCDGNSNSTDAMLILRYSLGLSMSGTGWCVN